MVRHWAHQVMDIRSFPARQVRESTYPSHSRNPVLKLPLTKHEFPHYRPLTRTPFPAHWDCSPCSISIRWIPVLTLSCNLPAPITPLLFLPRALVPAVPYTRWGPDSHALFKLVPNWGPGSEAIHWSPVLHMLFKQTMVLIPLLSFSLLGSQEIYYNTA